jgi:hypothetical protein
MVRLGFLLSVVLALFAGAAPALANHETYGGDDSEREQPYGDAGVGSDEDGDGDGFGEDPFDWEDDQPVDDDVYVPQDDPAPSPPSAPQRPAAPELPRLVKGKIVRGKVARLRADGKAAIPAGAPRRVRDAIRAANQIVGKPYKWGGGHGRLIDSGYDCSGSVGYSLIRVGLMRSPMVSGQMAHWGSGGAGRWISVHANNGHVYMEIAGLRLDTSPVGDPAGRKGVRWRPVIGRRGGFATRHPAGL